MNDEKTPGVVPEAPPAAPVPVAAVPTATVAAAPLNISGLIARAQKKSAGGRTFTYDSIQGETGFKVNLLSLESTKLMRELRREATVRKKNEMTGRFEEAVDDEIFSKLSSEAMVKGWSGLTYRILKLLFVMDNESWNTEIPDETPIPFTPDSLKELIDNSLDFVEFVGRKTATNASFNAEDRLADSKNLKG